MPLDRACLGCYNDRQPTSYKGKEEMNGTKEISLEDARKVVDEHQTSALKRANAILKEAWPQDNLQISLNLSKDRHNLNYNIKRSGMER